MHRHVDGEHTGRLARTRLRPRVVALILLAGAVVAARLLTHAPTDQPSVAANDLNQPTVTVTGAHVPMSAGSPRAERYAPGVPAIPVSSTAQPGQPAITEADVRAYYTHASPPFWDSETPRPDLIAVECGSVQRVEAILNRSLSRPDGTMICMAIFRGDGNTFAGVPLPSEAVVVRRDVDEPVFAVHLFDGMTGNELGSTFVRSWP